MKAVVDAKNADIDAYIAGAAGDGAAMKALVFGVPPEPFEVPDDANPLTQNLAHSRRRCARCRIRNCCTMIG